MKVLPLKEKCKKLCLSHSSTNQFVTLKANHNYLCVVITLHNNITRYWLVPNRATTSTQTRSCRNDAAGFWPFNSICRFEHFWAVWFPVFHPRMMHLRTIFPTEACAYHVHRIIYALTSTQSQCINRFSKNANHFFSVTSGSTKVEYLESQFLLLSISLQYLKYVALKPQVEKCRNL